MPNYYQSTEAVKQLYITMFTSAFHNYISECMLESLIVRLSKVKALLENQTMQHYRGGKKNFKSFVQMEIQKTTCCLSRILFSSTQVMKRLL